VRGPERQICFTRPSLPSNLTEVRIQNLRVGDATADFVIARDGSIVTVEILRKTGNVEIVESV
jgi:hypothetical protein